MFITDIISLVKVKFSNNATTAEKDLGEQAYLQFEHFLTDADGMLHISLFTTLFFADGWLLC